MFNKPETWRVRKIDSVLSGTLLESTLPWLPPRLGYLEQLSALIGCQSRGLVDNKRREIKLGVKRRTRGKGRGVAIEEEICARFPNDGWETFSSRRCILEEMVVDSGASQAVLPSTFCTF